MPMGVVRIDGMPFVVVRCRTASACPWHPRASVQTYVVQHAAVQTRRAARCPPCPMMLLSCQSKSRTRMAAQYSVLQRCCTPLVQQLGAGAGAPAAVTRQPLGTRPSVDHHWTRRRRVTVTVTWCITRSSSSVGRELCPMDGCPLPHRPKARGLARTGRAACRAGRGASSLTAVGARLHVRAVLVSLEPELFRSQALRRA